VADVVLDRLLIEVFRGGQRAERLVGLLLRDRAGRVGQGDYVVVRVLERVVDLRGRAGVRLVIDLGHELIDVIRAVDVFLVRPARRRSARRRVRHDLLNPPDAVVVIVLDADARARRRGLADQTAQAVVDEPHHRRVRRVGRALQNPAVGVEIRRRQRAGRADRQQPVHPVVLVEERAVEDHVAGAVVEDRRAGQTRAARIRDLVGVVDLLVLPVRGIWIRPAVMVGVGAGYVARLHRIHCAVQAAGIHVKIGGIHVVVVVEIRRLTPWSNGAGRAVVDNR